MHQLGKWFPLLDNSSNNILPTAQIIGTEDENQVLNSPGLIIVGCTVTVETIEICKNCCEVSFR